MRESGKEFKEFQKLIKKFKDGSVVDTLFVPYNTEPIFMIAQSKFIEYCEKIRKPLEDEIIELKEHIRALKSSHDLSHQAYLFAKNEGLDLQNQERLKVIAELEEWVKKYQISVGDYVYITALNLNAKLCKMKAELEKTPQGKGEKDE